MALALKTEALQLRNQHTSLWGQVIWFKSIYFTGFFCTGCTTYVY